LCILEPDVLIAPSSNTFPIDADDYAAERALDARITREATGRQ
jgi:hypothetical protein